MEYVVDFDDLISLNIHKIKLLEPLAERFPDFKATLFTIPNRITKEEIALVKGDFPFVSLAPHGWEHTRGECLSWSVEEAADKIKFAIDLGLDAPIFRAPAWLINGACYQACEALGLAVASHKEYHLPSTRTSDAGIWKDVRQYIYNMPNGRKPGVRASHGHMTPTADNHILDMTQDGRLSFPNKATFIWPWEAAVLVDVNEDPKS